MDSPTIISVSNLTKYYGTTLGVKNINFTVNQGEIFGFLGPNGAGKTTTIRMLLDLLRPSSGQINIFGQEIYTHSLEIRKRCGYLPGSFSAYGNMSGTDFLHFAASMRKTEPKLQKSLIDRFQLLQEDLSQKVKHLSHGTLQKLGIIQAFFHQPELFILDEPTIGLDPLMQEEFYRLLHEMQNEGKTIFFSSHNLPEVEKVCHRIAIIREGELVALETLEGLKKKKLKRLHFTLSRPVPGLDLPGANLVDQKDLSYEYLVEGDIQTLLQRLSKLPIEDLTLPEPDLEEVFMAYYRKKK
ncbi:ABC transporter ATP-binding protein [candidate division KSB1 bacterium]|nr:ABC transporter ATP-binding protein [candidate division KSB1 bacterium]